MLLAEYAVVGLKGEKGWTEGEPVTVMAKLLVLASRNRLDWQVKSEVPLIAVNGAVGTVNVDWVASYAEVPVTTLTLDKYPCKRRAASAAYHCPPTTIRLPPEPSVALVVPVATRIPFMNNEIVLPLRQTTT